MVPPLASFASGGNYPILGSAAPLSPTIPAVGPSRLILGGANAPRMNKGLGTYCSDSSPDCLNKHEGELTGTLIVLLTPAQALGRQAGRWKRSMSQTDDASPDICTRDQQKSQPHTTTGLMGRIIK